LAREEMSPYLAEQIEWFNNLTRYKWGQDVEGKVSAIEILFPEERRLKPRN
jgi:hypothetical protein